MRRCRTRNPPRVRTTTAPAPGADTSWRWPREPRSRSDAIEGAPHSPAPHWPWSLLLAISGCPRSGVFNGSRVRRVFISRCRMADTRLIWLTSSSRQQDTATHVLLPSLPRHDHAEIRGEPSDRAAAGDAVQAVRRVQPTVRQPRLLQVLFATGLLRHRL